MKKAICYNIHNILKFKIIRDNDYGLRDLINLKFSFFEAENADNPDITLNIGKFLPSNKDCYLIDHKYYIKNNYFYCKDSEGNADWEVEITGFEEGSTKINFNGRTKGFQSLMNPDFIAQNFLLRFIEFHLSRKAYFLAHSAGICRDGIAHVLAGRGGAFKTSLCMDLIRNEGFEFLGDDRVILHKDRVCSFPMSLRVFSFMCDNMVNESSWNIPNKIKFFKHLWDSKSKTDNSIKIGMPCKLNDIIFIKKNNFKNVGLREVPLDEAISKLIINNRLEDFISLGGMGVNSGPHLKYVLAYSNIFPNSRIAKHKGDLNIVLKRILNNVPIYEMDIPSQYNSDTFGRVKKLINGFD